MKQDGKDKKKQGRTKKLQLYRPRKKKSAEEDAAIQYLQAQYDKVVYSNYELLFYLYFLYNLTKLVTLKYF